MIEVIPAIIPKSLDDLKSKLERVSGKVKKVQIDIIDGVYDDDINWPFNNQFADFKKFEEQAEGLPFWQDVDFEFDLMIKEPEKTLDSFLKAGASAVVIHAESTDNFDVVLKKVREYGVSVGIALKPSTSTDRLVPYLADVDFVQFMGSDEIGRHDVEIDERIYDKIEKFHLDFPSAIVGVDIGVNFDTAPRLKEVGVTRLVSGSAIFNSPDIEKAIHILRENK